MTLLSVSMDPSPRKNPRLRLDRHGLRGARIGVFRQYFNTPTTDPELRAITEQTLSLLKQEQAVVVDPFAIPGYTELGKNLWCGDFQADLNAYLALHPNAPYRDLPAIVASGLYLPYIGDEIRAAVAPPKGDDRRAPCLDAYHDAPKIAFRKALVPAMTKDRLDAIVYPTGAIRRAWSATQLVPPETTAKCSRP